MERTPLVEDIPNYAQNIVDTVREPLLILDATLRVQSANRAFYQTFHVSPEETEGRLIYELGNGQWDIPDLRRLLEDIVPKSSVFNDFELEHTFPVIGRRAMLLNARKLQAGHHGELLVLAMEENGRGAFFATLGSVIDMTSRTHEHVLPFSRSFPGHAGRVRSSLMTFDPSRAGAPVARANMRDLSWLMRESSGRPLAVRSIAHGRDPRRPTWERMWG